MTEMKGLIDVENLLKTNLPATYKVLPHFIVNYIKKIIRQDDLNDFIFRHRDVQGNDFVTEIIKDFNVNIKFAGIENIHQKGNYVFASNHPLGGLDGVSLLNVICHFFGEVKAIVNELLLYVDGLKPVVTGVNVFGKFKKSQIQEIDNLYKSDKNILVFPSGEVSRFHKGKIQDNQWQKSFLTKAIEYQRDIVPVYTDAQNSKLFYNIGRLRKIIGLKANLELFLLPSELYKFKGKEIKFYFGKPIPYSIFKKEQSMQFWVDYIRKSGEELNKTEMEMYEYSSNGQIVVDEKLRAFGS